LESGRRKTGMRKNGQQQSLVFWLKDDKLEGSRMREWKRGRCQTGV
jgi:hypothetical protein